MSVTAGVAFAHRSITARRRATVVLVASKRPHARPRCAESQSNKSISVSMAICSFCSCADLLFGSKKLASAPALPLSRRLLPALNSLHATPRKMR